MTSTLSPTPPLSPAAREMSVRTSYAYAEWTPNAGGRCALLCAPHPRVRTHTHCAHQQHSFIRAVAAQATRERRYEGKPAPEGFTRQPRLAVCGHRYSRRRQRQGSAQDPAPFAYAWADYSPAIRHNVSEAAGGGMPPGTIGYLHPSGPSLHTVALNAEHGAEGEGCLPRICRGLIDCGTHFRGGDRA